MQGQTFTSPTAAQFGDVRLGARVRLWGEYRDPFQIAVGGCVGYRRATRTAS